jgi:hypothetical protein
MSLKPRDVIVDNWDREGIVVEQAERPAAGWLKDQQDSKVAALPPDTVWWRVLCIHGGAVIVPEPFARFVRQATIDDAMSAVACANANARRMIGQLFP